jgi:N-acyl-D-aspartate/D-glutamate deacylase
VTGRWITGGRIIDGTGTPARRADLLLDGDRIAAISEEGALPPASPPGSLEASGKVITPGFIDLHSHGDLILSLPPSRRAGLVQGRIAQGITTEVVGNCGLGPAPVTRRHEGELRGILGWMTPEEIPWPWSGIGGYLDHLERIGVPVNVATLVAHGAVRVAEAGLSRDLPSVGSPGSMQRSLEEALDEGAFGLSLGLIYPPGSFTPTSEILPLAKVVEGAGGILTAHIRGSSETLLDAVGEILEIGRETGARVHHSHSEAVGPAHWPAIPEVLRMEDEARRSGVAITFDLFPYTAAATTMAAIYPPWSLEGGIPSLLDRLRSSHTRRRLRREIERVRPAWPPWNENGWAHNLVAAVGWDRIVVGSVGSESGRWAEGMSLAELGRRAGRDPFEAVSDLMLQEEGRISQLIHGISGEAGAEEGLAALVTDPHGAFCTDANDTGRGRPHPAAYGTFPRILGEFVRERGLIPMEEAVRRMTSWPAEILGLEGRGRIREGAAADLVILDPDTVGSDATFEEPRRLARGIEEVIVNGRTVWREGRPLDGSAGRVLRR